MRGHVTITGGEPLIHPDCLQLLEMLSSHRESFSFAVLTNGTMVDEPLAKRLAELQPAYAQVSVEGSEATHDRIRGAGSYRQTVDGARHLVRAGVRTIISFTAHRGNYREFEDVARLGRRLGVRSVWSDRQIPTGRGAAMRNDALNPEETRQLLESMLACETRGLRNWLSRTEVKMHRALQFLVAGGEPYRCQAGERLIAVLPNGDLLPCRRMPVVVGNLLTTPLRRLYDESPFLRALRDPERVSAGCEGCFYAGLCRGGLKCLSFALTGDPFQADPGCWRSVAGDPRADASGPLDQPCPSARHAGR